MAISIHLEKWIKSSIHQQQLYIPAVINAPQEDKCARKFMAGAGLFLSESMAPDTLPAQNNAGTLR